MAEVTAMRNNALPYPVRAAPWAVVFPLLDEDGDPVTGASSPDSEVSLNGDTFADCTNEAVEIATSSGVYYLLLTAAEMTADVVAVQVKTASAKTTVLTFYPRKLVTLRAGTSAGGASGSITLDAGASAVDDFYNGCLVVGVLDSATEARIITDYNGSTKVASVTPDWNTTPDSNDTFTIFLPEGIQINQANVTQFGGANGTFSGGIPAVNATQIEGSDATNQIRDAVVDDATRIDASALNTLSSHDPGETIMGATDLDSAIGDLPTNSELATALAGADDAVLAAVAVVSGKVDTAQSDLDTLTGADGAVLATSQPNYAPAVAGDEMDLVDGALTAAKIAGDAITAAKVAADVSTEIAAAVAAQAAIAAGLTTLAKVDDTLEDQGYGLFGFTQAALQEAPTGGSAPTAEENAQAVRTELATELAHLDADVSSRASQASVDNLPTNAEFASAVDALPTASENAEAVASQTDIAAGLATVQKLDDTLEDQGYGLYGFTAAALQEAPTGSAPTAGEIADAVWEEAIADHSGTAGSTAEALNAAGSAGDPWTTALPGAYSAGQAGYIVGNTLDAAMSSRASQTSVDDLPTNAELAAGLDALPTAAENADAVWNEDATDHQTQGTFGQTLGDSTTGASLIGRVGAPSNLGSGATLAGNLVDIEGQTDDIGVAGAGLTALASAAALATAQADLDILTGADGAVLATSQPNYAPAVAGNAMSLVDDAITAAKFDESTAFPITSADTSATRIARTGADADTLETLSDEIATRASQASVDDLPTSAEFASAVDALPTASENASAVWGAGARTLTALDEDSTTIDIDAVIRAAVGLAAADLDTQLGALPTNGELATALASADDAVLAAIAALNDLSAFEIRTALGLASANLDTQLSAIDTVVDAIKLKTDLIPGTQDGYTFAEIVLLMASALLGKASGLDTTTAVFRALDDSKARITATVDEDGNRSAVTLDAA